MTRLSRPALLLLLALVPFLALEPLLAQTTTNEPGSFTEVIDVEVINLEVYVSDKSGGPVTGLGREDFELKADGKPVEITNFYAVEGGERLAGELAALPHEGRETRLETVEAPVEPLFLVVFVDNVHLSSFGRNRVIEELRPFLKKRMDDGHQVMVVTFDGDVDLRQPFTRAWKDVRQVFDDLEADPSFGHMREREHIQVIEDILSVSDLHAELTIPGESTRCPKQIESMARSFASRLYGRVDATVERLGDFVDTLGSLPGRKALLYVSDGLHFLPGGEVFEYLCQLCGNCARDVVGLPDSSEPLQESDGPRAEALGGAGSGPLAYDGTKAPLDALANSTADLFEKLTERANAHRVTFFTLESYGPRNLASSSAAAEPRTASLAVERVRLASLQDSLVTLAERTGGRAVLNTLDFAPALAAIGRDFDSYYSLGYSLPRAAERRDVRVKVEVKRPGVRVRYRKSLHVKPLAEQLADRTRATLMYGLDENPLGIDLEVGQAKPLDASLHMVPIRVLVPLDNITLLPEDGASRGRLTLFLAARDRTGRLAPVRTQEIPLSIPDDQLESARLRPYVYEVRMLMREGDHAVTIGLHDDLGGVASYKTESVMVFPR